MPVYAPAPAYADRRLHPRALVLIVGGHAVLLAAVMSVKMDLPKRIFDPPIVVQPIPVPQDPPPVPEPQPAQQQPEPARSTIDRPPVIIPVPLPDPVLSDPTPVRIVPDPDAIIGPSIKPLPQPQPNPVRPEPVRTGPRLATPASRLQPPYPPAKLDREEEAVLRLRLSIDERGRVVAVDPVGRADRVFLEAARRHLIAHWRYKPATDDGHAVPSTTLITLRFELTN